MGNLVWHRQGRAMRFSFPSSCRSVRVPFILDIYPMKGRGREMRAMFCWCVYTYIRGDWFTNGVSETKGGFLI